MSLSDGHLRRAAEHVSEAFREINGVVIDRDLLHEWSPDARKEIIDLHVRLLRMRTELDEFR